MANRVQLEAILKFIDVQVNPGVFNNISRAAAGMPGPVQQFNRNLVQSVGAANNVSRSVRGLNSQLSDSERISKMLLQRMAQFAILLPTFATLNRSIQGGVKFLFDFDAAIKDIIRVDVGELGDKFNKIADEAFKLSEAFGTSALDAVNTIKMYKQAGFDLTQSTEMARLSLLATKASTLDAAGATEFLLSATKQFKLEGQSLEHALDALVKAEDLSALEARDIADAFKTGGNSLAEFGKDINDAIGLISGLREQTRKSGNEIGTFFKTLQTRIFAAGESRSAIEALGITVQNLDGSLRPTLDVLNDLKVSFDGMTEAQVANAAKAIAGVRQFESLIGTINSLDRANEISAESSNAAGTARQKEAIDAQKLSRRLDDLVVAAQKLAFALGEAGGTDFFKGALNTATALIGSITKIVDLLDKMNVPIMPILAPIALKGLGKVFGVGGGGGGAGGMPGSSGGGGPNSPMNAATIQNVANMKQLSTAVSQLTQQMRILMQATMTQSQLTQTNIALEQLQKRASSLNIAASMQMANAFKGSAKAPLMYKTAMDTHLPTFKRFGGAVNRAVQSTKQIENAGARTAVQYTLLTLGATALTSALNTTSEKLGGNSSFGGTLTSVTSDAAQLGLQFAILGPHAAAAAAAFGLFTSIFTKYADEVEKNKQAFTEQADSKIRDGRLKSAPKVLSSGADGLGFLKDFGRTIAGRTNKQFDFNKSFNEAFKGLSPTTKAFIKNVDDLKAVLFDPSRGKDTIRELSKLDSAAFVNQESLKQLRDSYDANGKSTLSFRDQLNLFLHSLGQVDHEIDQATGAIKNLIFSFKEMKELQELIGFTQSVNNLTRDLEEASGAPEDFAVGIDKMRLEARYAAEDLANAENAFAALRKSLVTQGATEAGFNPADAEQFVSEINKLLNQPNSGAAISEFLTKRSADERKFGEEFVKIDKDRREAIVKSIQAESAIKNEIYKRDLERTAAQKEIAFEAADALSKFKNELIKVGTASTDTDLMNKITSLSSKDISAALKGGPGANALSSAIQSVIQDTFVDGVKKAENNLSKISEETANSIQPITSRIASLRDEIAKLGDVQPNTEKSAKKEALEREIAAKLLEKATAQQDGYIKSLEALRVLVTETKKAQEDAAKAEADRLKKTQALTNATHDFSKSMTEVNRNFEDFAKQKLEDLGEKQAQAYQDVKDAQQEVLTSTQDVSEAYRDYVATIIEVNGAFTEARLRANLLGRDIGILNGSIVTFQDRMNGLDSAFADAMDDANIKLEQRIQLERELAEQTLSFLKQAQDEIVNAGVGVFGQSAGENQGLQKGIAGLSFIAEKLGGSFQNFMGMDSQEINSLSQELLNLPVEFRQSVLDALAFLPSSMSIGGFSTDQLKQAIGQVGAGVAPEAGLPAISELTAQQVEQLKILGQLGHEDAKLQLVQVLTAQKALEKAQEQLDVSKIQEERAREGFETVRLAVNEETAVLIEANIERRDLLQRIVDADNANTLNAIEKQSQFFADQNIKFREIGGEIVQGIAQAINSKMSFFEAQTSLNNFNTMQSFEGNANGYIPNFAHGNLSPGEAAGLLRAAVREKKAMPQGARLAVANTREAIIPMYKNFASGNDTGNSISASISSIRTIDQTMVAAIARSVGSTLSQISGGSGNEQALDKIAVLLTELNAGVSQVKDSNLAIKANTAGLAVTGGSATPGAAAIAGGQEVKITLQTNQNNSVAITGLENLRDQLKQALSETTNKQVAQQIEVLMVQLDPIFQALNERGMINSFGASR